ncbi:hypothetical protein pdam_00022497 [Pocillopora damicornis]|uniref:DDE-1 domain-containing protein n=1 Tax=Pocillopora damicornis TaxID=46731 RepID=A0A3M6TNC5_POCDA|nr:hypothetical protein pdam_00022497 [Pocillopora damicornis]
MMMMTTAKQAFLQYSQSDIIAMDKTAVWQDMLSSTTVDNVDGIKLKPFIVFPGATKETKQLNEKFKNKCYAASSVNGWMNEHLTRDWLQGALGKFLFTCRITAWDFFKCHITESIKQELAQTKIDPVIVPGGCTRYIQAPDVAWNEPFKAKATEKYDAWIADRAHSFTAAGNMCGPPRREVIKWEGQPCHAGKDCLASIQQALEASRATDPFADVTLSDVEEEAP